MALSIFHSPHHQPVQHSVIAKGPLVSFAVIKANCPMRGNFRFFYVSPMLSEDGARIFPERELLDQRQLALNCAPNQVNVIVRLRQ